MMQLFPAVYAYVLCKWNTFKSEERGAVDIVAIVVMIGIAVLLAVLFRQQITNLLTSLFSTITTNATEAVEG